MAKQVGQSQLGDLIRSHASDETDYGQDFARLPGGIHGGVAELVDARIGSFKQGPNVGKKFLYLAGVVVEPRTATEVVKAFENGRVKVLAAKEVVVEGRRTALTLPLCQTKNQKGDVTEAGDNVATALNELRKVGGEECTADLGSEEDLLGLLETLIEAAPRFRFSTDASDPSAEYPTPRVWERWYGTKGLENSNHAAPAEATVDKTGGESEGEEASDESEESEAAAEIEEGAAASGDDEDLDALAAAADDGDGDAATKLDEIAVGAGLSKKQIDGAKSWADVAAAVREAQGSEAEGEGEAEGEESAEEEEPEGTAAPEKGSMVLWKAIDPKTKKPAIDPKTKKVKKAIECKVIAVDERKETVDLKSLDNPKLVWKGVKWDALEAT